jgi:hypothetical protein
LTFSYVEDNFIGILAAEGVPVKAEIRPLNLIQVILA